MKPIEIVLLIGVLLALSGTVAMIVEGSYTIIGLIGSILMVVGACGW